MKRMKRLFGGIVFFLLFISINITLWGENVGRTFVSYPAGIKGKSSRLSGNSPFRMNVQALKSFFDAEIQKGNLVEVMFQEDQATGMSHIRYDQFYQGIPVFGGQVVYHIRNGVVESINGEYYRVSGVQGTPSLSREDAVALYQAHVAEPNVQELKEETRLIIFPREEGVFSLAYQITLFKEDYFSMTGFIDAHSGEVLFEYSNIHFDEGVIGLGINYHGASMKLAVTRGTDGYYYLYDEKRIRPFNLYTVDYRTRYIPGDADNYWDFDGALVSIHALVGFVYDFYYKFFGRKGIDGNNLDTVVFVHNTKYKDNAFWNGETLNFCDPGKKNQQNGAALDVVAHEYTHGVTDYSSDLVYAFEPGALNESFSDIMGTTAEFYWYPVGQGLYMADWYIGEDATPYYNTFGCRNLADPNSNSQLGDPRYPDPCHLAQQYYVPFEFDNGGVHLNATIYAHAFYLLANGGRNRVSGIKVNGIGIDKASNIFYQAWVYYLTKTSDFLDAANALLQVAWSNYGPGSEEFQQTVRAMEAIGWIVKK